MPEVSLNIDSSLLDDDKIPFSFEGLNFILQKHPTENHSEFLKLRDDNSVKAELNLERASLIFSDDIVYLPQDKLFFICYHNKQLGSGMNFLIIDNKPYCIRRTI